MIITINSVTHFPEWSDLLGGPPPGLVLGIFLLPGFGSLFIYRGIVLIIELIRFGAVHIKEYFIIIGYLSTGIILLLFVPFFYWLSLS